MRSTWSCGRFARRASHPRARWPAEPTIELLGWLELPLDNAPNLIVTGFEDGKIPQSMFGDAFLPDGLRRKLGLSDADDRVARDLYAATVLHHSRRTSFVTGRRSVLGDPLVPSRLIFHCGEQETTARVEKFLEVSQAVKPRAGGGDSGQSFLMPRAPHAKTVERMRVTDFRTYLSSPYFYYLSRVLDLDSLDDRAREMSPRVFGIFAHNVLDAFGQGSLKDSLDPHAIDEFLQTELERRAMKEFGKEPMPAVALQLEQLSYRLAVFAERQAAWAQEGWRIEHAEWKPEGGVVPFDVDGTPVNVSGRIDRIDRNVNTGRYAILDYKTAEKSTSPESAHRRRDGAWKDLQLPLYCLLTASLQMEELPLLGYVNLGRDASNIEFRLADKWTEDDVTEGYAAACEVVRAIREERFGEPGRIPDEPVVQALCGIGLLGEEDGEEAQ